MPQPTRKNDPNRKDAVWTTADYTASRNLRRIWNEKYNALNLSHNKIARQWGITQPAVSNYLNSILRLNPEIILKFAKSLDVPPHFIDPRMLKLMRIRRPEYDHAINIVDDTYHPRFVKGDFVVINPIGQPKNQEFCVAYTSDVTLLGYLHDTELLHPVTDQPQTIPEGAIIHPIAYVIPAKRGT